jgi:hypothetical protein
MGLQLEFLESAMLYHADTFAPLLFSEAFKERYILGKSSNTTLAVLTVALEILT